MRNASHRPNAPPASAEELRRLWKRHHRRVLKWIRWADVPERHVEDVAQDAWMRVFRALDRYDRGRPFVPWLCVLVRRTALDHKKHAPERHEQLRETIEPRSDFHASTPEDRMDAEQTVTRVMQQLGDDHREVLILVEIEQLELKEVADALGLPVGTVQSRLARARAAFAAALARLRAQEKRRAGAVVPLLAFDLDTLFAKAREDPPLSEEAAEAMWQRLLRGIEAPPVPRRRGRLAGAFLGGAGVGGVIVYLWMRSVSATALDAGPPAAPGAAPVLASSSAPAPPPAPAPVFAPAPEPTSTAVIAVAPDPTAPPADPARSTAPAAGGSPGASAGLQEALSALKTARALARQGQCAAALARTRPHAAALSRSKHRAEYNDFLAQVRGCSE